MTEEKQNESKEKCCSDKTGEEGGCCSGGKCGCRCFKLALAVILLLVGFWAGCISNRCGMGMKCGGRPGMMMPHCPMTQNAPVPPSK